MEFHMKIVKLIFILLGTMLLTAPGWAEHLVSAAGKLTLEEIRDGISAIQASDYPGLLESVGSETGFSSPQLACPESPICENVLQACLIDCCLAGDCNDVICNNICNLLHDSCCTSTSDFYLNVVTNGPGTVTRNPGGAPLTYFHDSGYYLYPTGTVITLTANPSAGQSFSGWGGACSGIATSCQVTITEHLSVSAKFGSVPPAPPCPATAALANEGMRDYWLKRLRDVRDGFMTQLPEGSWMVSAYYEHADEVSQMLLADSRLRRHALHTFWWLRGDIEAAADGSEFKIGWLDRLVIHSFARHLEAEASPRLKEDLEVFLTEF
jgi:hypothetical protein